MHAQVQEHWQANQVDTFYENQILKPTLKSNPSVELYITHANVIHDIFSRYALQL